MKISEENFIREINNKNEKALDYVIDHYGWVIRSVVRKNLCTLKNHQEECINDILLAVWENIERYDEKRNTFKNWLAGVSKYKAIDYLRKYLRDLNYENIEGLNLSTEDDVCMQIIKKELDQNLEELLGYLKPEDKQLFLRLYVEEQEMSVVSKETGLKREVIYNRLSRSKKKLKKLLHLLERKEKKDEKYI